MTTLNTIIEEEVRNYRCDCEDQPCHVVNITVDEFTTAMQRAAKAERAKIREGVEDVIKQIDSDVCGSHSEPWLGHQLTLLYRVRDAVLALKSLTPDKTLAEANKDCDFTLQAKENECLMRIKRATDATTEKVRADWLRSEIEKLEGSGEICCECCNGDGWVIVSEAGHGCNGMDEDCARICPIQIQTQVRCDMCVGTGKIIHPDVTSIITRYKEELLELEKQSERVS